jgi:hypothetical protein
MWLLEHNVEDCYQSKARY